MAAEDNYLFDVLGETALMSVFPEKWEGLAQRIIEQKNSEDARELLSLAYDIDVATNAFYAKYFDPSDDNTDLLNVEADLYIERLAHNLIQPLMNKYRTKKRLAKNTIILKRKRQRIEEPFVFVQNAHVRFI
jgi:hypothetical protein